MEGVKVKIYIDFLEKLWFFKVRLVVYILCEKIEIELDWFVKEGIIELVEFLEWVILIVFIVKEDGIIRICGDYK